MPAPSLVTRFRQGAQRYGMAVAFATLTVGSIGLTVENHREEQRLRVTELALLDTLYRAAGFQGEVVHRLATLDQQGHLSPTPERVDSVLRAMRLLHSEGITLQAPDGRAVAARQVARTRLQEILDQASNLQADADALSRSELTGEGVISRR